MCLSFIYISNCIVGNIYYLQASLYHLYLLETLKLANWLYDYIC